MSSIGRSVRTLSAVAFVTVAVAQSPRTVTSTIREFVDRPESDLPARTATLQCPEDEASLAKEFECHGSLLDGRLLHLRVTMDAERNLHVTRSEVYDRAAETAKRFLAPLVVPAIASLECPPESRLQSEMECSGTLTDSSRFLVAAERDPQYRLVIGPITYLADPPSPLVRAVRGYVETFAPRVTSVRCPVDPANAPVVCVAQLENGAIARAKVTRTGDAYRAEGEFEEPAIFGVLRQMALALLVLGPMMAIAGVVWLVVLFRQSFVARVPFAPSQEVALDRAGDYVLSLEAPRFSNATGFQYSLEDAATGQPVPVFPNLFRSQLSGVTNVRLAVRRLSVERPGRYVLRIAIPPGRDVSKFSVVFSTAFLLRGLFAVLMMVGGALMLGLGIVARL